jgi:dihydrofolate reductase
MRKVVLYELLSLDGVAESPDGFFLDFDDVMRENLHRVIADQDAVLLGRRTYDDWAGYWPGKEMEPFAPFINKVRKYVVTSSQPASWENSAVVDTPVTKFVSELKAQDGGDIGVHGSLTLARTLLAEGLVDELRLVVAPAIAATGRKLFDGLEPQRFRLTRNVSSDAGYLLLDYQVSRLSGALPDGVAVGERGHVAGGGEVPAEQQFGRRAGDQG